MSIQARKLRALREAAALTRAQMSELLDEDEATLTALEASTSPLDLELVERPLLFRALNREVISELHTRRAHFALGDFLRTCGDLAELASLRERKGVPRSSLVERARKSGLRW